MTWYNALQYEKVNYCVNVIFQKGSGKVVRKAYDEQINQQRKIL